MKKINKIYIIFAFFLAILQFFYFNLPVNYVSKAVKKVESAESMITVEANSGRVLYAENETKRLPMASTTKIITAIVAIENSENLDKKYEIPKEAVGIEGSSIYLKAGEHLSIRELLYGLMLRSGNDSAVAIAIIVGGSLDKFVQMMNDFCKKLNLNDTNIVTVNGLHNDNHYTTASDLSKVTCYALKNKIFAEIVSTKEKNISGEKNKEGYRFLKNKNKLLKMVEGADGVKTGYTMKAGKCFVGSATRNDMQVVCVVLNAPNMFDECAKLIEKAFEEYSMRVLLKKGEITQTEIKNNRNTQKIPVILKDDIKYPFTKEEMKKVVADVKFIDNLSAPISDSQEIGLIEIKIENNLIFSEKIYTINIEKYKEKNFIKNIFERLFK